MLVRRNVRMRSARDLYELCTRSGRRLRGLDPLELRGGTLYVARPYVPHAVEAPPQAAPLKDQPPPRHAPAETPRTPRSHLRAREVTSRARRARIHARAK